MKKTLCMILAACMIATCLTGCTVNNSKEPVQEAAVSDTTEESVPETENTAATDADESYDYADLVVYGTIFTAEKDGNETIEAFAVKDGKYICVGNKEDIAPFVKEGETEVIDRTGEGLIIPGCTEGHSHYFGIYGVQSQLPCASSSYKEILGVLKEQAASGSITKFSTFGWNNSELRDRKAAGDNFAKELESIAPGIPVVLLDNTGHNAVCNTTALIKSGLLDHPEVRGGEVCLDKEGNPSGYVSDQAVAFVYEKSIGDILTKEQFQKGCITAQDMLLRMGYTNAFDAYLNQFGETSAFEALKALDDKGELKMNVAASYNIKSYDADIYKEKVDRVAAIAEANESEHVNPRYIKLFADGITEEGTGWMLNEYKNVPKGKEHGNIIWEPDELKDVVTYANGKGLLIHTHSYGDAACKAMLDACIASNEANGGEYRNCLGHVRNIKKEDIIRAAENGIPVAANLIWHSDYDDKDPKELKRKNTLIELMSEEIYYSGYPMKSLIENGVTMSSSTDAPAAMTTEGTAMNVLEVAVTGVEPNSVAQPFVEEELLTIEEGLEALTINGARQLGLEEERGSVKEGKYADFVILDKNILEYDKDQYNKIGETKVVSTYFEGKNVYSAQETASKADFGQPVKVADMLYEITYDEYSADIPDSSASVEMTGDMGCSSVRNGNFVGRNFDYFMNQSPTFVIRTTAKEGRYATIGVGRLAKINSEAVESGLPKEKLDLLPWFLLDGMNEKGLVVNSNVLFRADWGDIPHTGTNPGAPELNDLFLTRPLLDNCATVDEAIAYLRNYNITPMNSKVMDLHYMISDPEKTCVVEFFNNEIVVKEQNIMTNYFINIDKIPEHPDGLERMQVLKENYDEGNTMEGMYKLMQRAKYTNSYYASNKWYSEQGLTYSQILELPENAEKALISTQEEFEEELEYIKENGLRETTEWWDTTHNTIYDIQNKKIWVTVHERYEEGPHELSLELK